MHRTRQMVRVVVVLGVAVALSLPLTGAASAGTELAQEFTNLIIAQRGYGG